MLFAIGYSPRATSEELDRRTLKLFGKWQPPASIEIKGFYDYADLNGGFLLVEASSAEQLMEMTAPWAAFFEFRIRPIVPIETAAGIQAKAAEWRDSIA
jgi:hypothetical protein